MKDEVEKEDKKEEAEKEEKSHLMDQVSKMVRENTMPVDLNVFVENVLENKLVRMLC